MSTMERERERLAALVDGMLEGCKELAYSGATVYIRTHAQREAEDWRKIHALLRGEREEGRAIEGWARDHEAMEALRRLNPRGHPWALWFTNARHDEVASLQTEAPGRWQSEHARPDPAEAILYAIAPPSTPRETV